MNVIAALALVAAIGLALLVWGWRRTVETMRAAQNNPRAFAPAPAPTFAEYVAAREFRPWRWSL